ncbi:MAG: dephospho-CoA kinase [Sphingobacterium sp.]|jgi:dephospho-CoA kinase|uniref:dephospho-CoA kinase n=1 Tax=Sphingobacterium sp. CZ-UAM TaxID=1933868 RepID=UPI000985CEC5|nr:dephospho-CoA kinase [Sphingobacterium sp. CZ-UAM]MDF2517389.1 dephospho-CoA kinase [Sphingobacterium sp.]OOG20033.1 dephospho-CoA kinase [Sphingobacterium sp. CZ-UAM]
MGLKIGITGGIGSGKTFICRLFEALGIPVYNADEEAKKLMNTDVRIKEKLIAQFGAATYKDGLLDRAFLANMVFSDKDKLELLNSIVHPIVIQEAKDWAERQTTRYSLKEAALLFESGSYKELDYTILVTAPMDIRIQRVIERDDATEQQVRERINKQLSDEEKLQLADFVIVNDGITPLLPQVWKLHQKFLK